MRTHDFVIVGAGIVGLTVARTLALRRLGRILVLEKEPSVGRHASGRNSGILHAGIYYSADSWKAKVCATGAKLLRDYAQEHSIPMRKSGKVIVAATLESSAQIDVLYDRAIANGARVEKINPEQLRQIEPEARTWEKALFSPDTAVIDAPKVLETLEKEILSLGVEVMKSSAVRAVDSKNQIVKAEKDCWGYGHLINAAGLHADEIAHWMGIGEQYRILPFKGIYRKFRPDVAGRIRGSIYPVPDPRVPFLGVHLTRTIHDEVIAGPTAIPAFGRENYGILDGLSLRDLPAILWDLAIMVAYNQGGLRKLVKEETKKYRVRGFLKHVQAMAPSLTKQDIMPGIAKVGIRAQLVDKRKRSLVMDFVVEDGPASTHILNAVSPAFTGSLVFAQFVVDRIAARKN